MNNKSKIMFYNEFLDTEYANKDIYTHMVEMPYKTKKGNKKYKLCIYDQNNERKISTHDVIRCKSNENNSYYFMVIMKIK
jgi:hypothetical protein